MIDEKKKFIDEYVNNTLRKGVAFTLEYDLIRELIGSIYDLEQKVEELQDIIYNISERGL